MRICINPKCPTPEHPGNEKLPNCQGCGSNLLIDDCYSVTNLLSDSGGFGIVYEAIDLAGKPKILKILRQDLNADEKAVSLFQQEALVLGRIEHAGIPKIDSYVHHYLADGTMLHGIVMQKIEGLNLDQWLKQRNNQPIAQKRAIAWLKQLVEILALVHGKGYFHRDIKPANIMLAPSGQLVLIDFGTAREATHTYLAKIGGVQGVTSICSVGYTAPEQEKGFAVPQSDFYSLGCTMIHLVTGKYPLDTYNPERDIFEWRSQAPEISEELADLIDALIARKPSDRPLNCQAILKIIKTIKEMEQLELSISGNHNRDNSQISAKVKAKRKSIQKSVKQAIKESSRRPPSPILLAVSVTIAAIVGLSIGTVIKISAIGDFEEGIIPAFGQRQNLLNPSRFLQSHTDTVQSIALSPDGKEIASASDDGTVKIWQLDSNSSSPIREIKDQGGWVRAVLFLTDRQIITAGLDKNIRIIDTTSGKVLKTLKGHTNLISSLAIAPDRDLLVSGSYDNRVNLWQISTGKLQRSLTDHTDKVLAVAVSPNGDQIASASRDKTIRLWNRQTGKAIATLKGHLAEVNSIVFTPDGERLISAGSDRLIRVWDLATAKQLYTLIGHDEEIKAIAITNDGNYLFSGSKDNPNSIRLWNLRTRARIWNLIGHQDLVTSLAITKDDQQLISGSQDKRAIIWNIPLKP